VALFVVVVVGLIVALTWLDWRETRKDFHVPEWAKGVALAGILGACLTTATSFASTWLVDSAGQWSNGLPGGLFWPELGFLLCAMGVIIAAVRKKRIRLMLLLTALLIEIFWLGATFWS
jgi:multisubunit Na+/H+ antiporter MnhB subunit